MTKLELRKLFHETVFWVEELTDVVLGKEPWHPTVRLPLRLMVTNKLSQNALGECVPHGDGYIVKVCRRELPTLNRARARALLIHELLHAVVSAYGSGKFSLKELKGALLERARHKMGTALCWAGGYSPPGAAISENVAFFEHLLVDLAMLEMLHNYEPESLQSADAQYVGPTHEYNLVSEKGDRLPASICDRLECAFGELHMVLQERIKKLRQSMKARPKK